MDVAKKIFEECECSGSEFVAEKYFGKDFRAKDKEYQSLFLKENLSGLMKYNVSPKLIAAIFSRMMILDGYSRVNSIYPSDIGSIVLECTGSGKKPYKTLNISTPSIIVAVAAGAKIIKKGSSSTSSLIGSSDLLYSLGFKKGLSIDEQLTLLRRTGFTFVDIENVIPRFNEVYNGQFFSPHILSYVLAATVTSIRGNKIIYGICDSDVKKACESIRIVAPKTDITVYSSSDNGKDFYDEILGNSFCSVCKYVDDKVKITDAPNVISNVSRNKICAPNDRNIAVERVVMVLENNDKTEYCTAVIQNAAFFLVESGVARDKEALLLAKDTIQTGRAYRKLVEIINESGGKFRKTW